jgi:hypothetical protein
MLGVRYCTVMNQASMVIAAAAVMAVLTLTFTV